jgi:hypothetical protein
VPTQHQLVFGTLLSDKYDVIELRRREYRLLLAHKPTSDVDDQIAAAFDLYNQHAQQAGLSVCGQGNGEQ